LPHTDYSITGDYEVTTRESYEHIKVATSLITQAPVAARKSYQIGLTDGCGQIVRLHTSSTTVHNGVKAQQWSLSVLQATGKKAH
jgi:hypothetical protein